MPGDGAGEPELGPAAGPEGGCAEPGPGAPGSQRRVFGALAGHTHLSSALRLASAFFIL